MITPTSTSVLKMRRQFLPSEQLKVILLALPEIEKKLGKDISSARKSLRGLWAGVDIAFPPI